MHLATLSTGMMYFEPLYKAVAIVEVARSTSMITTIALFASYKCIKAGEKEVCKLGLDFVIYSE
jgi:hypothetical protein